MVKTKVTTSFSFKRDIAKANSKASRQIKADIVDSILDEYNKGLSPVKGVNNYKAYRPSTAKRKGRRFPVNLKESGRLHASLKAVQKTSSSILLFFSGARNRDIAKYHQFGTPHMDARPMLPTKGQEFKKRITDRFIKIVRKALKQIEK